MSGVAGTGTAPAAPPATANGARRRSPRHVIRDFSSRHQSTSVAIGLLIVAALLPLIILLPPFNGFSSQSIWVNGFTIAGIGIGPINPIFGTLLYERVPEHLRARVFGAVTAGVMAGAPIGALLGAGCVEWFGLQATFVGFGLVYLACTLSPLVVPAWRDAGRRPALATE